MKSIDPFRPGQREHHGARQEVVGPIQLAPGNTRQSTLQNIDQLLHVVIEEPMDDLTTPGRVIDLRDQRKVAAPATFAMQPQIDHGIDEGCDGALHIDLVGPSHIGAQRVPPGQRQGSGAALEHRIEQPRLVPEVIVDEGDIDAGGIGHLPGRHPVEPALSKQ